MNVVSDYIYFLYGVEGGYVYFGFIIEDERGFVVCVIRFRYFFVLGKVFGRIWDRARVIVSVLGLFCVRMFSLGLAGFFRC